MKKQIEKQILKDEDDDKTANFMGKYNFEDEKTKTDVKFSKLNE